MDDLLREAIADAKAVRETALENAKIALEEAFTPRLQSMLSKKIATEIETDEDEAEERSMSEEDEEEMKMDSDELHSDKEEDDAEERSMSEEDEEEMKMDADEEEAEEMKMDADELESDEMKMDADEEEEEEMAGMKEEEEEENDDLDLESVLAELEKDLDDEDSEDKVDETEKSDKDEEEKVDENDVSSQIGASDNKVNPEANDSSKTGAQGPEGEGKDEPAGNELDDHQVVKEEKDEDEVEEDLDLDEVLKALSEEEKEEEEADKVDELKKEIKETRDVVKFMRAKLNEVNLLNAKLLFSNKLFRAFGLNNDQKLKVVENFDRTTNLREVKLVYATLAESFKKPSRISESVSKGSSSKPVASTKPAKEEVLSEGAELKARFKKLANIL
jgi:hypothetical protein